MELLYKLKDENGVVDTEWRILEIEEDYFEISFYNNEKLISVVIPEGLTRIDRCAFCGCSELQLLDIPDNVKKLGKEAFSACPNLTIRCSSRWKNIA